MKMTARSYDKELRVSYVGRKKGSASRFFTSLGGEVDTLAAMMQQAMIGLENGEIDIRISLMVIEKKA